MGYPRSLRQSSMDAHAQILGACMQVDLHLAELTVKETLNFSARVLGPGTKKGAHSSDIQTLHSPSSLCSTRCLIRPFLELSCMTQWCCILCCFWHALAVSGIVLQFCMVRLGADDLRELRARERKLGIQPDPDLDGFQKAAALHGQRSSPITLFIMRLLGLEVPGSNLSHWRQHSPGLTVSAGGVWMGTVLCMATAE